MIFFPTISYIKPLQNVNMCYYVSMKEPIIVKSLIFRNTSDTIDPEENVNIAEKKSTVIEHEDPEIKKSVEEVTKQEPIISQKEQDLLENSLIFRKPEPKTVTKTTKTIAPASTKTVKPIASKDPSFQLDPRFYNQLTTYAKEASRIFAQIQKMKQAAGSQSDWENFFHIEHELFIGDENRWATDEKRSIYNPVIFSLQMKPYDENRPEIRPIDVIIIKVTPPNEQGFCNFGANLWHSKSLARRSKIVLAEVEDPLHTGHGEGWIHVSDIDKFVLTPS